MPSASVCMACCICSTRCTYSTHSQSIATMLSYSSRIRALVASIRRTHNPLLLSRPHYKRGYKELHLFDALTIHCYAEVRGEAAHDLHVASIRRTHNPLLPESTRDKRLELHLFDALTIHCYTKSSYPSPPALPLHLFDALTIHCYAPRFQIAGISGCCIYSTHSQSIATVSAMPRRYYRQVASIRRTHNPLLPHQYNPFGVKAQSYGFR